MSMVAVIVGAGMPVVVVIVSHERIAFLVIPLHALATGGPSEMTKGVPIGEAARLSGVKAPRRWPIRANVRALIINMHDSRKIRSAETPTLYGENALFDHRRRCFMKENYAKGEQGDPSGRSSVLRGGYQVVETIVINTSGFQMGRDFDGRRK